MRCADAVWWAVRTASVRTPRSALSASNGDGVAPCSTEYDQIASSSSCSPAITPMRRVVVAGDALRRRVHDEVDAVGERLLADRRGERRVDHGQRALDRRQLVEIDELEARVRRRLGQDEHRAPRLHRGRERARGDAVDQRHLDAEPCARALQERDRARRTAGAGRRCGRRSSRSPARSTPVRPCRTRTPTRRRRPRARRSPPRTNARSGSSTGCRTRCRASRSPGRAHRRDRVDCHTLEAHSAGASADPLARRPALIALLPGRSESASDAWNGVLTRGTVAGCRSDDCKRL